MRKRVFVSYSHADRDWMDRLKLHLAVLERRGKIDVWSDARIAVGQRWSEQIEAALGNARIAVLLVSPAFLASDYVWKSEMPRIVAHEKNGMRILPLVVRPCAWRLTEELAHLQARPADGRPLSTGSDAQIDVDLTAFAYELAGLIDEVPDSVATDEWERMTTMSATAQVRSQSGPVTAQDPELIGTWRGRYDTTNRDLTLHIERCDAEHFSGRMEYDGGDVVTRIEGRIYRDVATLAGDPGWERMGPATGTAVTFRDEEVIQPGRQPVSLDGEYRGFVNDGGIRGIWISGNTALGQFTLARALTTRTSPGARPGRSAGASGSASDTPG